MSRILVLAVVLVFVGAITGCASIFCGGRQEVTVLSNPTGATVTLSNGQVGQTPARFMLKRGKQLSGTVALPGYAAQQVTFDKAFNPWFLGNLIIGGPLGMVIDLATGAIWKVNPSEVNVDLRATSPSR